MSERRPFIPADSRDPRSDIDPRAQAQKFYTSFTNYVDGLPLGRAEYLALSDMSTVFAARGEVEVLYARVKNTSADLSRRERQSSYNRLNHSRQKFNFLSNNTRTFISSSLQQRYEDVLDFFSLQILPGLREAGEAILSDRYQNIDCDDKPSADEIKGMVMKDIAKMVGKAKDGFIQRKVVQDEKIAKLDEKTALRDQEATKREQEEEAFWAEFYSQK